MGVHLMPEPPPLALARQIAPHLTGLTWAIGGSTLLHELGLVSNPHDLDLVVAEDQFMTVAARLTSIFGPQQRLEGEHLASRWFARFDAPPHGSVDVMAGIAVVQGGRPGTWYFDPASIRTSDGLPWMSASDWLHLYRLFDRPDRVAMLEGYLAAQS